MLHLWEKPFSLQLICNLNYTGKTISLLELITTWVKTISQNHCSRREWLGAQIKIVLPSGGKLDLLIGLGSNPVQQICWHRRASAARDGAGAAFEMSSRSTIINLAVGVKKLPARFINAAPSLALQNFTCCFKAVVCEVSDVTRLGETISQL